MRYRLFWGCMFVWTIQVVFRGTAAEGFSTSGGDAL